MMKSQTKKNSNREGAASRSGDVVVPRDRAALARRKTEGGGTGNSSSNTTARAENNADQLQPTPNKPPSKAASGRVRRNSGLPRISSASSSGKAPASRASQNGADSGGRSSPLSSEHLLRGETPRDGPNLAYAMLADTLRTPSAASSTASLLTHSGAGDVSVCVVVHIRPLVGREIQLGCSQCLEVDPKGTEVSVATADKTFGFDQVFGLGAVPSSMLYPLRVAPLLNGVFSGYNATVLAYGQTGSGKTFTMGTGLSHYSTAVDKKGHLSALQVVKAESVAENSPRVEMNGWVGVVPTVMNELFDRVEASGPDATFTIKCSFIEVYQNNIRDLLDASTSPSAIEIREHSKSQIQVLGVKEAKASSREEMVGLLYHGMSLRATSGTSMNLHSSRSHAIFTISIEQQRTVYLEYGDDASPGEGSSSVGSEGAAGSRALGQERLSAKMHLVDLAGSERIKKSGASGLQQKEAACINLGLLNLRNVIEALIMKLPFVPYRSNKLTRLLQDSLGGTARTLFVACVSPADNNMDETLSTLQYAADARKIRNKPVCHRDKESEQFVALKEELRRVREELNALRETGVGDSYNLISGMSFNGVSDVEELQHDRDKWRTRATMAEAKVAEVTARLELAAQSASPGVTVASGEDAMVSAPVDTSMVSMDTSASSADDTLYVSVCDQSLSVADARALETPPAALPNGDVDPSASPDPANSGATDGSLQGEEPDVFATPPRGEGATLFLHFGLPSASTHEGGSDAAWLREALGDQFLQQAQLEHQLTELSSKAHLAEAARSRLLTLEGSLLQRKDAFLRPPQFKREVVEWVQRAACLENQEQELGLIIDAEMAKRASLAAELRLVRCKVQWQAELGRRSSRSEAEPTGDEQERVTALEAELARRSGEIADLQKLQLQARGQKLREEASKKNLAWITRQDARLVLAATYRNCVTQYGELLGMQGEVLRLRSELRWRDRLLEGLQPSIRRGVARATSDVGVVTEPWADFEEMELLVAANTTGSIEPVVQSQHIDDIQTEAVSAVPPASVSALISSAACEKVDRAVPAAALLAQLSANRKTMAGCGDSDLTRLCELLSRDGEKDECRRAGALCLGAIVRLGPQQASAVVRVGAVPALLSILTGSNGPTAEGWTAAAAAATALEALARSGDDGALTGLASSIGLLLEMAAAGEDDGGAEQRAAALGCIAALVQNTGTVQAVASRRPVPELATALSNSSQDRSSASAAAAALAVLADTEEKAKQVVACRGACSALSSLLERTDGSGAEGVEVARKAAAGLAAALARWPAGRTGLVQAVALPPLVRYLWVEAESWAGEAATAALRCLAASSDSRAAALRAGVVFAFVHVCSAGSPAAREDSAWALAALGKSSAVKEVLGRVGGIPALVGLLRGGVREDAGLRARVAAVYALARLVTEGGEGPSGGAAQDDGDEGTSERSTSPLLLWRAALAKDNRLAVVRGGGERGLTALLLLPDVPSEAADTAAECLHQLSLTPACRDPICASGAPAALMDLLRARVRKDGGLTGGGAVAALGALEHLAGDAEAASVMRIGGGVICLGGLLSEDAPPVARSRAASALAALIDSPSMCDEVESCSGAIRRVVAMLELDRAVGEQAAALRVVRALATHSADASRRLVANGAIPHLLRLIDAPPKTEEALDVTAAEALGELASLEEEQVIRACAEGVPLLLPAAARARSGSPLEAPTLAVLCAAVTAPGATAAMLTSEAAPYLTAVLQRLVANPAPSGKSQSKQLQALALMQCLSMTEEGAAAMVQSGAVVPLVAALRTHVADGSLCAEALSLLNRLLSSPGGAAALLAAGGIPPLLAMLPATIDTSVDLDPNFPSTPQRWQQNPISGEKVSSESRNRRAAAAVLALVGEEVGGAAVRAAAAGSDAGAAVALTELLSDTEGRCSAARVMTVLLERGEQWTAAADAGAVPSLAAMLVPSGSGVGLSDGMHTAAGRTAAAECLAAIARLEGGGAAVSDSGAMHAAIELLEAGDSRLVVAALAIVSAAASSSAEARAIVDKSDALRKIVTHLSGDTDEVTIAAAAALDRVSRSDAGRVDVGVAGAVRPLVDVLQAGRSPAVHAAAASALESLALDRNNRQAIAAAGGVPALTAILASGDDGSRVAAGKVLTNLALEESTWGMMLAEGIVPLLAAMLGSGQTSAVRDAAAGAVENLALHPAAAKELALRSTALPALVDLLGSGSDLGSEAAAGALENLALHDELRAAVAAAGAVPPLVGMLGSGWGSEAEAAAGAIQNLALDAEARAEIATVGGVAGLVGLLSGGSEGAKETAAGALGNLALDSRGRALLVHAGGIPELLALLGPSATPGAREAAAGAVENCSFDDIICRKLVEAGAVELLVDMMHGEGDGQREAAAAALRGLCPKLDEAKLSIAAAGGLSLLLRLLRSRNGAIDVGPATEATAAVLQQLQLGHEQVVAIASVGGMGELLSIIQKADAEEVEAAARTIANSAVSRHGGSALAGVPVLLQLLKSGDDAGREGAARALQNLALSEDNRALLAELGGVGVVMEVLLREGAAGTREAALGLVENMALSDDSRMALLEAGAAEAAVWALGPGNGANLQRAAARALINMASQDRCKVRITEAGAVPPLVELLNSEDDSLVEAAARALQNLSLLDSNRAIIAREGGIGPLLSLLERGSLDAKQEVAARALWSLAVRGGNREAIVRHGGISLLLDLARRGTPAGQEAAASALQNLAVDEDIGLAVERSGGLRVIVSLLSAANTVGCRAAAAGALQNMALCERNRESAAVAASIPLLIEMLSSDAGSSAGQAEAAAGALRNLAMSDSNCEAIAAAGGVGPLAGLLGGEAGSGAAAAAAGALENLLLTDATDEGRPLVLPAQVIPPLLQLLLDPDTDASVRDAAIGALEGAAQSDDARLLIGALGAVPVLVELVRAGRAPGATGAHTASAALAAGLLETLAVQPRNAEQMVEEGLPRELCGYLQQAAISAERSHGHEAAAGVLCNLALTPVHRSAVVAAGAVPLLLQLLLPSDGDLAAVGAAANALKNVALGDSVCQRAVLEAGGEAAVAKAIATLPLDTDIVKTLREALAAARRASSDGDDRSGTEANGTDLPSPATEFAARTDAANGGEADQAPPPSTT